MKALNKFFVYDGLVLIAAQPRFDIAMKYFKKGRTITKISDCHKKDLTKIANKLIFSDLK